jgi:hypothetical protein
VQLKPTLALLVFILVVSLVTGCTANTSLFGNNQARNVSTTYPTAGRSELLQGIEANFNESEAAHRYDEYHVTWMNNTTITIHMKITSKAEVTTWDYKFTHFPTIEEATAYFDNHQLRYTYNPDMIDHASLYAVVTGDRNPSVSKEVTILGNTTYHLEQIDPLIIESSSSVLPQLTATVTATPSPPQLSRAQLNAMQLEVGAKGYNITQPLKLSGGIGDSANGSTFYKGTISKNPGQQFGFIIIYNFTVEVCKDNRTANSQFSSTVNNLQKSGIAGSYTSPTQWAGVTTLNGIKVDNSVTKSATGPPYTITTIE